MHPVVTESGRLIGYYSFEEAGRLFAGHMRIKRQQIIVSDEVAAGMTVENGWRFLRNSDGTYSLWNSESFEREFGVKFDSTIRRREDIRWARKRQLQSRFQQLITGSESPTWSDVERKTVKKRSTSVQMEHGQWDGTIPVPAVSEQQDTSEETKWRQPSEKQLKALEARVRVSEEQRAEMERERQEVLARRGEQKARAAAKKQPPQSDDALEPQGRHLRTKRTDQVKSGWREVTSQGAMRESRKRELEQKEKQRRQREERNRQLHPEPTPQKPDVNPPIVEDACPILKQEPPKDARLSDEEILSNVAEHHGKDTHAQLKTLLERKTMEGAILRVITIAGFHPEFILPRGFSLDASSSRIRNFYCKSNLIRTFCLDFLASLIERSGNTDAPYGAEPLTWALDHCEDASGPKRSAARQILAEREHTLVFSESCIEEATTCKEPLTYIPYKTTLVRIPGYEGESWGVAALQDGDEISLVTIGRKGLTDIAHNMLAFVENRCSPHEHNDGTMDYSRLPRKCGAPHRLETATENRVHRVTSGSFGSTATPHISQADQLAPPIHVAHTQGGSTTVPATTL